MPPFTGARRRPATIFLAAALDHHTVWFEGGSGEAVAAGFTNSTRHTGTATVKGAPYRDCLRVNSAPLDGHPEFSTHPPGVALLLAPNSVLLFRGTHLLEPLAICCSAIATIIAMLLMLRRFDPENTIPILLSLIWSRSSRSLGTPAWLYGRTLFNEPWLLLFAIGSYSLALRGKNPVLAGALIGLRDAHEAALRAPDSIPLWLMYCVEAPSSRRRRSLPCPPLHP